MKIKEIMSQDVKSVTPETLLSKASRLMRDNDVGCLPVVKDGRIVGMVTDRDIVVRALAEGRDPDSSTAGDIMTDHADCVQDDAELDQAVQLMESKQIRRIPVVDGKNHLAGILSLGDLAVRGHEIMESGEALERICARPALAR